MAKNTDSPHERPILEMAYAEVARQDKALDVTEGELTAVLQRLWRERQKDGGSASNLDPQQLAVRQHAAKLLNGSAPANLVPADANASINYEQEVMNQREGVRMARRILADKTVAIRAAQAVEWLEANRARWRELSREVVFTVLKLHALNEQVTAFLATCPDLEAVRLEFGYWTEFPYISDATVEHVTRDAIEAGVVTQADIKKAKSK
jgi:hypothetical protein